MKKLFVALLVALLSATVVSAQDIITKRDGQDVKAVIEEVGTDYVKFKYFEELDGPVIVLKTRDIFRIQYQSGRVETFEQKVNPLYDNGREPVEGIQLGQVSLLSSFQVSDRESTTSGVGLPASSSEDGYNPAMGVASIACVLGALGLDIWSIVDAVKIAKVKNMYQQDLKKLYAVDVDLFPSVNYAHTANGLTPTVGMTLALKF